MMERYNLTSDDIRYLVPHQANLRIIGAANRIGLTRNKCMINIDRTATATQRRFSAMSLRLRKRIEARGDKLILASFGGGCTTGSVYVNGPTTANRNRFQFQAEKRNGHLL